MSALDLKRNKDKIDSHNSSFIVNYLNNNLNDPEFEFDFDNIKNEFSKKEDYKISLLNLEDVLEKNDNGFYFNFDNLSKKYKEEIENSAIEVKLEYNISEILYSNEDLLEFNNIG